MRSPLAVLAVASLMVVAGPAASAQAIVPYNQRVRWSAPPTPMDSTTVEAVIVDIQSGLPVPALLCVRGNLEGRADSLGVIRVSGLGGRNVQASVLARGYRQVSMVFQPGMRGRSYVTVRMIPDEAVTTKAACRDAVWPV